MKTREKERRDSIIVIVLILLLGVICIILASGWAVRFAPRWKLNTNMGSNLNPNSDFLTSRPVGFIEPLDPAILTNPAWINVFLTPGASFETRIPQSTGTATATLVPVKTNTPIPSAAVSPTRTLVVTVVFPTMTRTPVLPPPSTVTPNPPPTNTTVPPLPLADLQITKTDGVTTYTPGGTPLTYTITVRNNGPTSVTGAVVTDAQPTQVTTWTWVCTSQNGGANGCNGVTSSNLNFSDTVNLPNGAWIVYTVTANTSAAATSNLVNTANVAIPSTYADPNLGNNSATDTDTEDFPLADLQIAKTDGVTTYTPGGTPLTYTITVRNNGPTAVTGAVVTDAQPTQVTTWTWVCTSQTGGANGCNGVTGSSLNFSDTVNLPNGGIIVYTVTANTSATATGNLVNIADVAIPSTYADPNLGNNSATDTDTEALPLADLQIIKTDGVATYTPGGTALIYTITVTNLGPTSVIGAIVTDAKPIQITTWTWVCTSQTGGASGCNGEPGSSVDFSDTVNLPNGGSIVYTVTANTSAAATGNLVNTVNVAIPSTHVDPDPSNNSATDTDIVNYSTDLGITKTDGVPTYTPGGPITYTIVVTNAGPSNAVSASVTDPIPTSITGITLNCVASGTASCGTNASVGNNLSYTGVNISAGAGNFLTITVSGTVISGKVGNLTNTATVTAGSGQTDPAPGNDSDTDTDTPVYSSDLSITKTDNAAVYTANTAKTYIIVVSNAGPSDAVGATVTDIFSTNPNLASASWICSVTGAATCSNGAGDINDTINIAVGATVTYTVTANVAASPSGNLVNTATVSLPTDPNNSNNSATDTDQLFVVNAPPQIGTTPDGSVYNINPGTFLIIQLGTDIVVGAGDPTYYDLVYYEVVQGSGIAMDSIRIEVGDGGNWYTILDWGTTGVNVPDTNTNIAVPLATPPNPTDCLSEPDNCSIDGSFLYSSNGFATGITIDLDSVVPPGTYRYLRFFAAFGAPSGPDVDGGVEVDAIEVLPP